MSELRLPLRKFILAPGENVTFRQGTKYLEAHLRGETRMALLDDHGDLRGWAELDLVYYIPFVDVPETWFLVDPSCDGTKAGALSNLRGIYPTFNALDPIQVVVFHPEDL